MIVPSPDPSLASCHTSLGTKGRNRRWPRTHTQTAWIRMTTTLPTGHTECSMIDHIHNIQKYYLHKTISRNDLTKLQINDIGYNNTAAFHEKSTRMPSRFSPLWCGLLWLLSLLGSRGLWVFYCPLTSAGYGHTDESLTQTHSRPEAWSSLFLQTKGNRPNIWIDI